MPEDPEAVFTTSDILKVAEAPYYRLDYLVRTGQVKPAVKRQGKLRYFVKSEALKAIELLKDGKKK